MVRLDRWYPRPGSQHRTTVPAQRLPAGKLIHAILDNYGTHKHPKALAWLERHPRWTLIPLTAAPALGFIAWNGRTMICDQCQRHAPQQPVPEGDGTVSP